MKAAEMKKRPAFSLMKQTDVQNIYPMQMPRWLFSDPRYAGMSLDATFAASSILILPPCSIAGGAIAMLFLAGMYDLWGMRDDPMPRLYGWKRSWRQNWQGCC